MAWRADHVYHATAFASGWLFNTTWVVIAVFRIREGDFDALQLVLVGTVLEAGAFVTEIPTGAVADLFGRKPSVIAGYAVLGVSYVIEGILPLFGVILVLQVVRAVGFTLISGAHEAWVADEMPGHSLDQIYLRASQFGRLGAAGGIVTGALVGGADLRIPLLVTGVGFVILGGVLVRAMAETGFDRTTEATPLRELVAGARRSLRHPMLATALAIAVAYGASSESIDRLWELQFLDNFVFPGGFPDVWWFGALNLVGLLLGALAAGVAARVIGTEDARRLRLLTGLTVALGVAMLGFAAAPAFGLAAVAFWAVRVVHGVVRPIFTAWVAEHAVPRHRATLLSTVSQMDALGQVGGGPIAGWLGNLRGVRVAIGAAAAMLLPALPLYGRVRRLPPSERR